VTGRSVGAREHPRRPGDPARLVADSAEAARVLGWAPRLSDLETVVEHAVQWHERTHDGR
jgi:UDP-glucose 4-epimerase